MEVLLKNNNWTQRLQWDGHTLTHLGWPDQNGDSEVFGTVAGRSMIIDWFTSQVSDGDIRDWELVWWGDELEEAQSLEQREELHTKFEALFDELQEHLVVAKCIVENSKEELVQC